MSTFIEEVPPPPDLTNFIPRSSDQYSNGGSFGDVYRCLYNRPGADAPKEVAVKAFRCRLEDPDRSNRMIRRELGIWSRLDHKNIVPFLGIAYGFGAQGALSLVSEWMVNDTLRVFLEKHGHVLNVARRLQLLLDIAHGLNYLHSFPIVHGDLSCTNVLLDANYTARLADFGYASLLGDIPEAFAYLEMSTIRPGAMRWAAPEKILAEPGFKLTTKSDMYSFGCISLQVLSGKKPWSEVKNDIKIASCVEKGLKPSRPETPGIDNRHWKFIQRCWLPVQKRPLATEAITCIQQFLNSYPQSGLPLPQFESPATHTTLHISDITLNVGEQFGKTVDRIKFQTGDGTFKKDIFVSLSPGTAHREGFDDALGLSVRDQFKISLEYRARFERRANVSISIALSEVIAQARDDGDGRKIYFKFHKGIEVVIGIASFSAPSEGSYDTLLPPATSEIPEICPRFRLLIIGNSGVGKATLIRKVFGVEDVHVFETSRGRSHIDDEFIGQENGHFVFHEWPGLEAGESDGFNKVTDFIKRRREKKELKDRLHAIWVCIAVPFAGGRLFEAGMEEFLQRRKEILGNIPIVVVLTKLDLLDGSLSMDIWDTTTDDPEKDNAVLEQRRDTFLHEHCIEPLLVAAGDDITRVAVSTEAGLGLESTISELVKMTTSEIERHVKADPSYTAIQRDDLLRAVRMAFGPSIEEMTNLTIALGKKRYWRNLSASLAFSGEKVKEYLLVIHEDIIRGWNFNDPEMALLNDDFKAALLDTCNLEVSEIRDPQGVLSPVTPVISALAPLITDMIGVVFVLPVAGTLILARLFSEIYKPSQTIVKRFMAYIVDLMCVMKILFVLSPQGSITSQDVALTLQVYKKSTYRNRIHLEIRDFSVGSKMLPGGRDSVMDKIEELIGRFEITDKEVVELRSRIQRAPSVAAIVAATS